MFSVRKDSRCSLFRFVADRKGSTAIAMAILTPIMVAGLAFGSEVGFWELTKRRLQNAADTAAFAAATQKRSGLEQADFDTAALTVANDSGFTLALYGDTNATGHSGTLLVETPPTAGAFAGDDDAIMVTVNTTVERRFSKLFLSDDITIAARATAQVRNPRPACVLALHPTASDAIEATGSTEVTLTGCDIAANSIAGDAVSQSGSGELEADCISTVGGVSIADPNAVVLNDCPEPIEDAPITADPYRNRPEPTWASCSNFSQFTSGNPANPAPGCYGNGSGSSVNVNKVVNLSAGVYIFNGGDWKFNANAVVTGTGVTLFLTNGATISNINGNATFQIKAPTDIGNPYRGLAIYVDRDFAVDITLNGGSNFSISGAIYGASANIDFSGNTTGSAPGECTQVIGATVTFTGNSDFDTDCSNSGTTDIQTALSISLVE